MSGLRNTSGKFSLGNFGRKVSDSQHLPSSTRHHHADSSDDAGSMGLDGFGKKIGNKIAHQSLLPSLGNKDLRLLQEIITSEKGVLQQAERLGFETQKAAATLPPYGAQEGPDLQDVLTHSSTLLNQLGTALSVFVDHSANLRGCYKRIREREEELENLRRRRRSTGAKAESAERKLAKMGPENKQLPAQTELLEKLRTDMRQLDTDITAEESKLGDYKRQQVKEALSYKFGGLEELGEKMCIIGELGKLLIEEIPLEETPPGYGRAPYLGYTKTENATNEATKCLATVKFSAASSNPKPPGLPLPDTHESLGTPQWPASRRISAAEEFADFPGGANAQSSPEAKRKSKEYSLDTADPYGGLSENPYENGNGNNQYDEYGGTRHHDPQVVFQGPTDEALAGSSQEPHVHDYEFEQQKELDAEREKWNESGHPAVGENVSTVGAPSHLDKESPAATPASENNGHYAPWQPLNVKREHTPGPAESQLRDGSGPPVLPPILGDTIGATPTSSAVAPQIPPVVAHDDEELAPPRPLGGGGESIASSDRDGFYTPREANTPEPNYNPTIQTATAVPAPSAPAAPAPPPAPAPAAISSPTSIVSPTFSSAPGSGKISAAAFRRGAKPRGSSVDPEETGASPGESKHRIPRKLPLPPGALPAPPVIIGAPTSTTTSTNPPAEGASASADTVPRPETPIEANFQLPESPAAQAGRTSEEAYMDALADVSPPPQYAAGESLR